MSDIIKQNVLFNMYAIVVEDDFSFRSITGAPKRFWQSWWRDPSYPKFYPMAIMFTTF